MKATISINMDNAAFTEDGGRPELARILRKLADDVENGKAPVPLRDANGNTVGSMEIEG